MENNLTLRTLSLCALGIALAKSPSLLAAAQQAPSALPLSVQVPESLSEADAGLFGVGSLIFAKPSTPSANPQVAQLEQDVAVHKEGIEGAAKICDELRRKLPADCHQDLNAVDNLRRRIEELRKEVNLEKSEVAQPTTIHSPKSPPKLLSPRSPAHGSPRVLSPRERILLDPRPQDLTQSTYTSRKAKILAQPTPPAPSPLDIGPSMEDLRVHNQPASHEPQPAALTSSIAQLSISSPSSPTSSPTLLAAIPE